MQKKKIKEYKEMNYRRSYYNFNEKNVYTVKLIYFFKDKKNL